MSPFHLFLAFGMLVTGSINTITTKAADQQSAPNRYGDSVEFNHPFVQAVGMFIGEFLCLIAFYLLVWRARVTGAKLDRAKPFSPFIFVLPALCDMTATSIMYLGLGLTDASIFQMLRGSVVVFTGILSMVFLKRKLGYHHWIGIVLVMGGTAIVGAQSAVCGGGSSSSADQSRATIGNILIIVAQLIVAVQMVVEEKFIGGYDIPALQVVGFEGLFGMLILSCVLVAMYFGRAPSFLCSQYTDPVQVSRCEEHFEDTYDAFVQFKDPGIIGAVIGNVFSIAFFNYFGVSVTKHINAATRMVLDSLRTIVIWAVSLGLKWETFCWVQIIGFVVLIAGTVIYNALIKIPGLKYEDAAPKDESEEKLLPADNIQLSINDNSGAPSPHIGATLGQLSTPSMGRAAAMKGR